MRAPLRAKLAGAAIAACAALCLLAPAAGAVTPSAGNYQAQPKKLTGGTYSLGLFAVAADGDGRRIVSSENYPGIYYPDAGKCDDYEVPLATESVPISRRGRFKVRERTPVRKGSILVVWRGAWEKPRLVSGSIRIRYRGCDSKIAWVGRRSKLPATG